MTLKINQSPKWTLCDLGLLFVGEFFMIAMLIWVATNLFGGEGVYRDWEEGTISGVLYIFQTLALLIPLFLLTQLKYREGLKPFRLNKIKIKTLLKRVGQAYLMYYIASAIFIQIMLSYEVEIPGYGEQESHIPLFGETTGGIVIGGMIIVLIAPLVEEFLFRGYIYQILKKYSNVFWGSIFSAGIFALFHMEFQVFIPLFVLGLILNWSFEKSKSLWVPITFHVINNALAFSLEIATYYEWIELPT